MDIERDGQHQSSNGSSNSFSKSLCQILRLARFIPFFFISGIYIWGLVIYVYYVIHLYYQDLATQIVLSIFFVILYFLSFSSYLRCVLTFHRSISPEYHIPESLRLNQMTEDERNQHFENIIQSRNLPIFTRNYNGYVRYCIKCNVLKPDRAHHCSTCGRCICKMDHHCHWVSNCVAFDNYKFFILFLMYTPMLCFFVVSTSSNLFIKFWKDEDYPGKFQVFFLEMICTVFSLSIIILLSYHIYLVCKNVTTLESYQVPRFRQYEFDYYRFNLGCKRNLKSVFGDNGCLWCLPIFTSHGDGHFYQLPLVPGPYDKNNSMTTDPNHSCYQQALIHQRENNI